LRAEVESLLAADRSADHAGDFMTGPLVSDYSPDLIGRQVGPYRVLSLLGAGGMGEVYRARDSKLGRDVPLKILPAICGAV
jgi:serine/threonine protein kinase